MRVFIIVFACMLMACSSSKTFRPLNQKETASSYPGGHLSLQERLDEVEKDYILDMLALSQNNITQAAKKLGLSRQSLQYRMRKLGLK